MSVRALWIVNYLQHFFWKHEKYPGIFWKLFPPFFSSIFKLFDFFGKTSTVRAPTPLQIPERSRIPVTVNTIPRLLLEHSKHGRTANAVLKLNLVSSSTTPGVCHPPYSHRSCTIRNMVLVYDYSLGIAFMVSDARQRRNLVKPGTIVNNEACRTYDVGACFVEKSFLRDRWLGYFRVHSVTSPWYQVAWSKEVA